MATPPVFSAGSVLTAGQMNAVGLWKIADNTFTNQASVTISNCFTSDFDWYRLEYAINSTSTAGGNILQIQPTASGTPATTSYICGNRTFDVNAGAVGTWGGSTVTTYFWGGYVGEPNFAPASGSIDLFYPQAARHTICTGHLFSLYSSVAYFETLVGGVLTTTTQYDGVKFSATANNITGTVRVYGYRN